MARRRRTDSPLQGELLGGDEPRERSGVTDPARAPSAPPPPLPLAERMRPERLDELVGQGHLFRPGAPLARAVAADRLPSLILWGPPGSGKTSIAAVIAVSTHQSFERLSAV